MEKLPDDPEWLGVQGALPVRCGYERASAGMKLFLVAPKLADNADRDAYDARLRRCVEPIADLIAGHIGSDPALFGVRHADEVTLSPVPLESRYGEIDVVRIADGEMLRKVLLACGDPFGKEWILIRSLVTCRAVFYGYDGQAFVCLPGWADPIVSPDPGLIVVEERSEMLLETEWLDGLYEDPDDEAGD